MDYSKITTGIYGKILLDYLKENSPKELKQFKTEAELEAFLNNKAAKFHEQMTDLIHDGMTEVEAREIAWGTLIPEQEAQKTTKLFTKNINNLKFSTMNNENELKEQPIYPGWPKGWTKEEIEAEDREIAQALKAMNEEMARGEFPN